MLGVNMPLRNVTDIIEVVVVDTEGDVVVFVVGDKGAHVTHLRPQKNAVTKRMIKIDQKRRKNNQRDQVTEEEVEVEAEVEAMEGGDAVVGAIIVVAHKAKVQVMNINPKTKVVVMTLIIPKKKKVNQAEKEVGVGVDVPGITEEEQGNF